MAASSDQLELQRCLGECIRVIEETSNKIRSRKNEQSTTSSSGVFSRGSLDTNIYTFTLDRNEEQEMDDLKETLQGVLNDHLPSFTKISRQYLLDALHEHKYNYDQREFTCPFNIGLLNSLLNDLQGILASIGAFQAAWNGDDAKVQEYIKKYPTAKNQCGLWGTTLLYSAAKNNHLRLVQYLVKKARCEINAQNRQHLKRALSSSMAATDDFQANPSAGSTALHGACFNGHSTVVKFLLEHGADCFLKNHAEETPIMNAEHHPKILEYFRDFLVLGYSSDSTNFPTTPIFEDGDTSHVDCFWEYKPFADRKWFPFSGPESDELQRSLMVEPGQEFKREIHLRVRSGVYGVSMMNFLRSGKDLEREQKLAWVRCRGSSILNFDCYALWQIMFFQHPTALADPSLSMLQIPTIPDSRFKVHLNTWYFCDVKTNNQLDLAMKHRRKHVTLNLSHVSEEELACDMQQFEFSDRSGTTLGFIRWIPKLVSNNARNRDKIIGSDDFQSLPTMDPIPLTTARMKQLTQAEDQTSVADDNEVDENVDDEDSLDTSIKNAYSVKDFFDYGSYSPINTSNGDAPTTSDDCINEKVSRARSSEQAAVLENASVSDSTEVVAAMNNQLSNLKIVNNKLQKTLEAERGRIQALLDSDVKQTAQHQEELVRLMDRVERMERDRQSNEKKEAKLEQLAKSIKTVDYKNIQPNIVHNFFTPKLSMIIQHLRDSVKNMDSSLDDRIPRMIFQERADQYIVSITGLQAHQDEFKEILKRIWSLTNVIDSAKSFYKRHLNRLIRTLMKNVLRGVPSKSLNWREYVKIFSQCFQDKNTEYENAFNSFIQEQLQSFIEPCILGSLVSPWLEIRSKTDTYISKNPLTNEVEGMKKKALDEFIRQNICAQRVNAEVTPTKKSAEVLQAFIDKARTELTRDSNYRDNEVKHFAMIPKLLQRLMLYYCSFKTQLPLYESSKDLLEKIEKHAVTTISTSTGSGKSTLLPALLVAEGYDKVIVTQPRRLPCQLICQRVNATMTPEVGNSTEKLAGWAVSGSERNPQAKVLYLTDGLLKERLLYDDNFLTNHTQLNKSVVFFIDEVHERSVNIDLCLALLARLLTVKPEMKSKMKIIVSSATLDPSVPALFCQILNAGLAEFRMPNMGTLHPVTKVARPNENVLDIVQELSKKRKRHDQILCFVSSVAEVNQCCKLIGEISRGTIVAYPLVQSQHPNVQQSNIEHGTVFFSTTVAETSLTFPSLKYVVDSGMINTPVYDFELKRTVLKEVRAAESTIKQRLGRLGRTQPGEYYSTYNFKVEDVRYPVPQICQSDLMNIEFSLRKSPLQKGFEYMRTFLPNPPSAQALAAISHQLKELGEFLVSLRLESSRLHSSHRYPGGRIE